MSEDYPETFIRDRRLALQAEREALVAHERAAIRNEAASRVTTYNEHPRQETHVGEHLGKSEPSMKRGAGALSGLAGPRTDGQVVLKWSVRVDDEWHPMGAGPVVGVECQNGPEAVQVWTVEPVDEAQRRTRHARVYGTGMNLPPRAEHVGMAVVLHNRLVWHVVRSWLDPLEGMPS